jgi:hypothetical protein
VRKRAGKRYRSAIVRFARRFRRTRALAICVAFTTVIGWPTAAVGGVYKCARDDGTVMYQEDPCPAGRELRDFDRDPATVSVVPFTVPPPPAPPAASSSANPASPRGERKSTHRAAERRVNGSERKGNAAERKFLIPGIGEGEVVARVGRPDMSTAAGRKTVRWTYLPVPDDPGTITTLTFELGRLVQVERKVIRTP